MGLIKAAVGAIGGTLADSWKEAIHSGGIDNTILLRHGKKMTGGRSSNKKGNENVISNGSVIMVEENMCMLTIDGGKVTNVVCEPGEYIFENSTSPSIFAGDLSESVMEAVKRFTFGGNAAKEQRVIYINLQPIPGIPFGTGTPMPYPDPRYNTTIELRFYGTFEIKITDAEMALRFYKEVASKGSETGDFYANDLFKSQQYKSEFMQAMMQALSMMSANGVSYNQISSYLSDLTSSVQTAIKNNWYERGFSILNIGLGPITISDESKELLKDRLKADTMLGGDIQRAVMTGSIARGIENAGSNSGGAMAGFMGLNMAANTGSSMFSQMSQNTNNSWTCSCGGINTGKFCENCGKSQFGKAENPQNDTWKCSNCGMNNNGKFCSDCGSKKPEEKFYKCNKCGWIPQNPKQPPKFCPECGDLFNESDC